MAKTGKIVYYNGKPTTISAFAEANGCTKKVAYRYFNKYGTLDGFDNRYRKSPRLVEFKGELLTFEEIAERLGVSTDSVRIRYYRKGNFYGFCEKRTTLPWLEKSYHTLDPAIPLDRCISEAGYRSVRQFCIENGLSCSQVCEWRNRTLLDGPQKKAAAKEMVNHTGISIPLARMMEATGRLEWELFPMVFTEGFYNSVYSGLLHNSNGDTFIDDSVSRNEKKRIVRDSLRLLPQRSRIVLKSFFGIGGTKPSNLSDLAVRFGISRERVRQIVARAIKMLRNSQIIDILRAA